MRPLRYLPRAAWPALVALVAPVLCGCAATGQRRDEVAYREPGRRVLDAPEPYGPRLADDHDFAWLADSAYSWTPAAGDKKVPEPKDGCPAPETILAQHGWSRWPDFPSAELGGKIWAQHLRIEVWMRPEGPHPAVAVSFGGTVFNNRNDWLSNLRWFLPGHTDEYSTIVDDLAPAFRDEYRKRLESDDPAWRFLRSARLYSTGHSLGGGLAQQFAYAWPIDAPHRVDKVYAYDPSPVTGYGRVKADLRDTNRQGLDIDRVYERGEVLALLRSITSFFVAPAAQNPRILGVRYSLFWPSWPVGGHSISHLACAIEGAIAGQPADPSEVTTGAAAARPDSH